jgi:hypothetical protein
VRGEGTGYWLLMTGDWGLGAFGGRSHSVSDSLSDSLSGIF